MRTKPAFPTTRWPALTSGLVLAVLAGPPAVAQHAGNLFPKPSYSVSGFKPNDIASGDFDQDGLLDLAMANMVSQSLGILRGAPGGTFLAGGALLAGWTPAAIAVGDFDDDEDPDLAVANHGFAATDTVTILHGGPGASFSSAGTYDVGLDPIAIVAADFDDDGDDDLAVVNEGSFTMNVLLAEGSGFSSGGTYVVGAFGASIATGDFDDDGDVDLVVASEGPNTVRILLGNGDGSFTAGAIYNVGDDPRSVAVGDFNQDGDQDIAVALGTAALVLRGGAGATFSNGGLFPAGAGAIVVAAGDFDADGHDDLALIVSSYRISILGGQPGGTFSSPTLSDVGPSPSSLLVSDFDLDGDDDVAVANGLSANITVLLSGPDGSFPEGSEFENFGSIRTIVRADLDQDGDEDLALLGNAVYVLVNEGGGIFTEAGLVALGWGGGVEGDFDQDGDLDLATADPPGVHVLLGAPGPGFVPSGEIYAVPFGGDMTTSDFDLDGDLDLAVVSNSADSLTILLGSGDGSFTAGQPEVIAEELMSVAAADFNADGDVDLAMTSYTTNTLHLRLGGPGGSFVGGGPPIGVGGGPVDVEVGDFDDDADPDLVVVNKNSSTINILRGGPGSGFSPGGGFASWFNPTRVTVGDVDLDGDEDLVVTNEETSSVSLFLGQPGTGFALEGSYLAGEWPGPSVLLDFDDDGDVDIGVCSKFTDPLLILPNLTPVPAVPLVESVLPASGPAIGGATVTISGSVEAILGVTFGGVPGTDLQQLSDTSLQVVTPPGLGTVDVEVTNTAGSDTLAGGFTYVPAGAFVDLGPSSLPGEFGEPVLGGTGDLTPGVPPGFALTVSQAPPFAVAYFFLAVEPTTPFAPFYGGTFYPLPILYQDAFGTDGDGALSLPIVMPAAVPSATALVCQVFFLDGFAPFGVSGSNGLRLEVP